MERRLWSKSGASGRGTPGRPAYTSFRLPLRLPTLRSTATRAQATNLPRQLNFASFRGVMKDAIRPQATRGVIWAAAPAPAPAPQDPRCRVPAASRLPRLPIRRPGSASYNAALWPRAYRACHAACSAAPRAPRPAGRPRASRSRIPHATPSTPLPLWLISRGRKGIRARTIAALRRADGHHPGRLDLVAVRFYPAQLARAFPVTQPDREKHVTLLSSLFYLPPGRSILSPSPARFPSGGKKAVPSKDYSRLPPWCAGFKTGEGREDGLGGTVEKKRL